MSKIPWEQVFRFTAMDVVKLFVSAAVIVLVTKIQHVSDRLSALVIALPFTSIIAMVWMHLERPEQPERIANHAEGTFWFVLPTLPMFLILPWMLRQGWGFATALLTNCAITAICFLGIASVLRHFGIKLL